MLQQLERREPASLLIAFLDLTHFTALAKRLEPEPLAALLDEHYERVTAHVREAGGAVVKFMGDAAMVVFSEADADRGVRALLELKAAVDRWLTERHVDSQIVIKVHFGEVIAGPYGGMGEKRFDILGGAVNTAATIETRAFAITADAFRKLAPETRRLFKKHTPPITYIPLDAPRP